MCENMRQSGRRMLTEALMSPEGYRYITSPEGYQYIMSLPPPTPEIAEEAMMQRMRQDGLERVSTAMMSPEGYQCIKAQPVIAPSETPGSPPHSLVEPAPSTGPLAGGLEMLPHSPSPWSRLDTRLDASLERLDRIEEEWGILVNTDDYGDDAKAMEDCFRPHNYKKAHRANPRPPPPTHTSKSFKQTNRSGFQVAFSKIKLRVSSFNFQVSTSKQRSGSGFQVAISKFLVQTKLHVRVSSCNFQVSSFKPRSRSGFQVAIFKFQMSNQDPDQGFKLQFPSFKFQIKIQVRVSSCKFQVSNPKPRSRSGFQVAISEFQVPNQDPGQGFKLQFPSFKFQTKI